MKYVVYCDGNVSMQTFVETLEEAMLAFDRMTILCNHWNHFTDDNRYLTCAEMNVFTTEEFVNEIINGGTDFVYCDTIEDYFTLINDSFVDEWDNFEHEGE